jgi:signal recognition particle receptor subunit beta
MKDDKLMIKQAEMLQRELEGLTAKCPPELLSRLNTVVSRAREHSDRSFVILVAGPVKSGKSTFVNLVANAFVSPTHFLECTVRPSIISASESEHVITVYKSENKTRVVEQVDAIIDHLRGQISYDAIPEVSRQEWPLTPANIDEHVALDISDVEGDGTLMTTIKTPGGKLLTSGVYMIDMPGFDGSKANLDSPLYRTIASRADLIILVQSSNSAVTKVSDEFFALLRESNRNVPVCLLHNVFDAAFWRGDEQKKAAVAEQMEYAVARIKEMGFNLDARNAYAVNLGMVWDWRDRQYVSDPQILQKAVEVFAHVEQEMYDVLLTQRDSIRIRTVIGRTLQQMEQLMDIVGHDLAVKRQQLEKYTALKGEFDALKGRRISLRTEANVDWLSLRNEITGLYSLTKKSLSGKYKTREARELLSKFIADCSKAISRKMNEALKYVDTQVNGEEMTLYKSAIADVLRRSGADEPLPQIVLTGFPPVHPDLSPLDVEKIVRWNPFGYGVTKVNAFLAHVYYYLVGREDSAEVGYISFVLPETLKAEAQEHVDMLHDRISDAYGTFVARKSKEALGAILSDPLRTAAEIKELEALLADLRRIYSSTENAIRS